MGEAFTRGYQLLACGDKAGSQRRRPRGAVVTSTGAGPDRLRRVSNLPTDPDFVYSAGRMRSQVGSCKMGEHWYPPGRGSAGEDTQAVHVA